VDDAPVQHWIPRAGTADWPIRALVGRDRRIERERVVMVGYVLYSNRSFSLPSFDEAHSKAKGFVRTTGRKKIKITINRISPPSQVADSSSLFDSLKLSVFF